MIAAIFALTACEGMSRDERIILGGLTGATLAVITADALEVDDDWVILTALAGAAVGVLVARNRETNECAYKRRDGRYRVERCP